MKTSIFILLSFVLSVHSFAQQQADTTLSQSGRRSGKHQKPAKPPVCYIGLSTGLNNPSGVVGFEFNIKLGKFVTFDAGAGPSTWGNKLFIGAKYYLKENHRGWALDGGFTFNSGEDNRKIMVKTPYGDLQNATFSCKPQENAYVAVYHYWTLGRKYNRFFVDMGKSVALHQPHFREVAGPPIDDNSRQKVKDLSPGGFLGGFMAGVGFSFGLYRR